MLRPPENTLQTENPITYNSLKKRQMTLGFISKVLWDDYPLIVVPPQNSYIEVPGLSDTT
jgi:hypothetical protein